jgi:hypothetical protein
MPGLTDADTKAFIGKVIAGLAGNKAILTAGRPDVPGSGWDPTVRITALKGGEATVATDEEVIAQVEVTRKTAIDARRADLERNAALASASISSAEGSLGKDHPFVVDLHQIRGSLSNAPAKPAEPPKP